MYVWVCVGACGSQNDQTFLELELEVVALKRYWEPNPGLFVCLQKQHVFLTPEPFLWVNLNDLLPDRCSRFYWDSTFENDMFMLINHL